MVPLIAKVGFDTGDEVKLTPLTAPPLTVTV
jgi:hypothetical protein